MRRGTNRRYEEDEEHGLEQRHRPHDLLVGGESRELVDLFLFRLLRIYHIISKFITLLLMFLKFSPGGERDDSATS